MTAPKVIKIKQGEYFCSKCNDMVHGQGYIVGRQVLCLKHYKDLYPRFEEQKKEG